MNTYLVFAMVIADNRQSRSRIVDVNLPEGIKHILGNATHKFNFLNLGTVQRDNVILNFQFASWNFAKLNVVLLVLQCRSEEPVSLIYYTTYYIHYSRTQPSNHTYLGKLFECLVL